MRERRQLLGRIDPYRCRERAHLTVLSHRPHDHVAARPQRHPRADQLEGLASTQGQRSGGFAGFELQRQHAHVDQVAAMDALEALGDDRLHAEEHRPLRGPVARRPRAVFLAGKNDQRNARPADTASPRRRCSGPCPSPSSRPSAPGTSSRRLQCPEPTGCAAARWQRCRASSPRDCRAERRMS